MIRRFRDKGLAVLDGRRLSNFVENATTICVVKGCEKTRRSTEKFPD